MLVKKYIDNVKKYYEKTTDMVWSQTSSKRSFLIKFVHDIFPMYKTAYPQIVRNQSHGSKEVDVRKLLTSSISWLVVNILLERGAWRWQSSGGPWHSNQKICKTANKSLIMTLGKNFVK